MQQPPIVRQEKEKMCVVCKGSERLKVGNNLKVLCVRALHLKTKKQFSHESF